MHRLYCVLIQILAETIGAYPSFTWTTLCRGWGRLRCTSAYAHPIAPERNLSHRLRTANNEQT